MLWKQRAIGLKEKESLDLANRIGRRDAQRDCLPHGRLDEDLRATDQMQSVTMLDFVISDCRSLFKS